MKIIQIKVVLVSLIFILAFYFVATLNKNNENLKGSIFKMQNQNYVEGEVILTMNNDFGFSAISSNGKTAKDKIKEKFGDTDIEIKIQKPKLSLNSGDNKRLIKENTVFVKSKKNKTEDLLKKIKGDSDVKHAQPNYIYKINSGNIKLQNNNQVNQENKENLWHIFNNDKNAGINADYAWEKGVEGEGVIVAVIDSGVDYTHSELKDNIWKNEKEDCNNGKDDDNNGVVDDCWGYDFGDNDNSPFPMSAENAKKVYEDILKQYGSEEWSQGPQIAGDFYGQWVHGTHVAGTIVAAKNNIGVVGVAPKAKIMILKPSSDNSIGMTSMAIYNCIKYAIENGADVINMSIGGNEIYIDKDKIISNILKNNEVIFVAASGNSGASKVEYPAGDENTIAVGSNNIQNRRSSFSTYGEKLNLLAPGGTIGGKAFEDKNDILSLMPYGIQNAYLSGTSMASPHVAGVIALALSKKRDLTPKEIKDILYKSTDDLYTEGWDDKSGFGKINVKKLIDNLEKIKTESQEISQEQTNIDNNNSDNTSNQTNDETVTDRIVNDQPQNNEEDENTTTDNQEEEQTFQPSNPDARFNFFYIINNYYNNETLKFLNYSDNN